MTSALVGACGAGDNKIDPGDLELRDLLGVSPEAATSWDDDQRASARRVLQGGLGESADPALLPLVPGTSIDERVARTLAMHDARRADEGAGAIGFVRIAIGTDAVDAIPQPAPIASRVAGGGVRAPVVEVWMSDRWDRALVERGGDVLAGLAADAGHVSGPIVVAPAPRLPVIASYVGATDGAPPRLVVNPVLLAALEPAAGPTVVVPAGGGAIAPPSPTPDEEVAVARDNPTPTRPTNDLPTVSPSGNPYSFYGSVAECAFAQRSRCESCLGAGNCEAITRDTDGNAECTQFGLDNGRGYFLICANLALAIVSVQRCAADAAPGCPRDIDAASDLNQINANANFVDDPVCGAALDGCLTRIYGPPPDSFPGLVDGGIPPTRPPRNTNVACTESCSDNDNCDTNASCGEGPSCNNSFSCDSACTNSNDQSGCGGNCNACSEDEGGGGGGEGCGGNDSGGDGCGDSGAGDSGGGCGDDGGGGGGGGCGDDSGGGGDGCGGGNDSGGGCGDDGSGGGGGCGGDSSSGGDGCGGSSDSGGGGCGGDSGGGGGGCGGSDSGGGGGGCGGSDSGGGGGGGCGGSSSGGSSGGGCGGGSSGGSSSSSCSASRRSSGGAAIVVSLAWALLPLPAAALVRWRSRRRAAAKRKQQEVVP